MPSCLFATFPIEELTEQQLLAADMNGDGRITSADAVALVRLLAGLV